MKSSSKILKILFLLILKYFFVSCFSITRSIRISSTGPGKIEEELVASALDVMALLPSVCSPPGALAVMPALLHLVTSVLKDGKGLESAAVQAGLRCLRTYSSHPYAVLTETQAAYGRLLQSCTARLLDWGKAGQEDRLEPLVLLSAVTEMLLNARAGLLSCPALLYPSLNAFQQSLQATDPLLQLHTIRLFHRLLQESSKQLGADTKNILAPYVHALAPKIVAHLCSPASRQLETQQQLLISVESLNCVEALASLAENEHCKIFKFFDRI